MNVLRVSKLMQKPFQASWLICTKAYANEPRCPADAGDGHHEKRVAGRNGISCPTLDSAEVATADTLVRCTRGTPQALRVPDDSAGLKSRRHAVRF